MYTPWYSTTDIWGRPPPYAKPKKFLPVVGSSPWTDPKILRSRFALVRVKVLELGLKLPTAEDFCTSSRNGKQNLSKPSMSPGLGALCFRLSTYSMLRL